MLNNSDEMTADDFAKLLDWVSEDQIQNNDPLTTPDQPSTESTPDVVDGEKWEDSTTKNTDDQKEQPKKTSWVAKLIADKNEYKRKYEELLASRETLKNDDEMDEYDRDEKIVDTTSRIAYTSERMSDLEKQVEDTFYQETPKASEYKSDINALKTQYPQLDIKQVLYLFASQRDPMLLLDQQQINKAKSDDLSMLWTNNKSWTPPTKDPSKMDAKSLEKELIEMHKRWEVM